MTDPIAVIREAIEVLSRFDIVDHDEDCLKIEALAALDQLEAETKAKDEALVDVYSAGFKANQALIAELVEALGTCKTTLESPNVGICDTIWISPIETLVDRIDAALAKAKEGR